MSEERFLFFCNVKNLTIFFSSCMLTFYVYIKSYNSTFYVFHRKSTSFTSCVKTENLVLKRIVYVTFFNLFTQVIGNVVFS
jgi:hypothetical protein